MSDHTSLVLVHHALTMRKPFFRKQTDSWYIKDDAGRFVFLSKSKSEAFDLWREMLRSQNTGKDCIAVVGLCDAFLTDHTELLSKDRKIDATRVFNSFCDFVGDLTLASKVTPNKVLEWIRAPKPRQPRKSKLDTHGKPLPDDRPPFHWSATRQRDAAAWIVRLFKWGHNTDRLSKNPLATLQLPPANNRQGVIDPRIHGKLVHEAMASRNKAFACYLIASHCGARPQQIRELTAAHCSHDFAFAVFDNHKTKHKTNKPLVVYFSPCMQTLLKILAARRPTGKLFRQDDGSQWTKDTACRRFARMRTKLGLDTKTVLYLYRHTHATDLLRAGVSAEIAAAMLGHTSSEMVRRIYSHLQLHDQELMTAARMAAQKRLGNQ